MDALLGDCTVDKLRRRKSFKWKTYPADVLPSFVAEMDFDIAEPIKDAVRAALDDGDCGYPHKGELGEAFASFAKARLGWQPDPDLVFAVPDVMTGITEAVTALTPPGSRVVITPPVYPPFFFRMTLMQRGLAEVPLYRRQDGGYDLDLDALERTLAEPDVRCFLLCSPHNPVGRVWAREELLAVADLCTRHEVELVVDEIHAPLVLAGATFVPFLSLDHELTSRALVFTSASKGWNIPGLKCGVGVAAAPEAAAALAERWDALLASHLGVLGTVAAFAQGLPWLDAMLTQLDRNRALVAELLAARLPDVDYLPPQASYLAWLDCRRLGLGDDPAAAFLDKGKVALDPGPNYGVQGAGFARLNIGTSPELITEAVTRMTAALG
jgi:cystathionine beta-lyase